MANLSNWILEKIKDIDPIDAAAVAGMTLILQPIVAAHPKFMDYSTKLTSYPSAPLGLTFQFFASWNPLAWLAGPPDQPAGTTPMPLPKGKEILSYIVAFVLAAIIIKYAPKMLTGATNIAQFLAVDGLIGAILGV